MSPWILSFPWNSLRKREAKAGIGPCRNGLSLESFRRNMESVDGFLPLFIQGRRPLLEIVSRKSELGRSCPMSNVLISSLSYSCPALPLSFFIFMPSGTPSNLGPSLRRLLHSCSTKDFSEFPL